MSTSKNQSNSKNQSKMKNEAKRVVSLKRIKDRLEAIEATLVEVERIKERVESKGLTERQFVFNQLFMDYIRYNDIKSQGKTYEEILPNILEHYKDFESISAGYRPNKFESFVDEVYDYIVYHVRPIERQPTTLYFGTGALLTEPMTEIIRSKMPDQPTLSIPSAMVDNIRTILGEDETAKIVNEWTEIARTPESLDAWQWKEEVGIDTFEEFVEALYGDELKNKHSDILKRALGKTIESPEDELPF